MADGRLKRVYASETRPLLQGARLTAWELEREGIEARLVVDSATGTLMRRGMVQAVIVGADRIARNGDVANKIGTYNLAVLAKENGIPFYVAAPTSTFDPATATGDEIEIEEHDESEIARLRRRQDGAGRNRRVQSGVRRYAESVRYGHREREGRRAGAVPHELEGASWLKHP